MGRVCRGEVMKKSAAVLGAVLLGGCSTLQGQPTPVLDMTALEKDVRENYKPQDAIREYYERSAEKQVAYRDRVLFLYLAAVDSRYSNFVSALTSQRKYGNSLLSIAGLYTAALASVTSGGVATGFAAASTFTQGSQGALNKDLFYEQTLPALINLMDSERAKVRAQIFQRLADERNNGKIYGLAEALADVARYEQAASVERAVAKLVSQSSTQLAEQEKAVEEAYDALSVAPPPEGVVDP